MNWKNEDLKANSIIDNPDTIVMSGAVIRYVAGCITRERERVAKIFETETDPAKISELLRSDSEDKNIFKWTGPKSK